MPRKSGKAPAFMFYAGDFLSDLNVQIMTMAQRGIYVTLLAMEWIEGSLPSDIRTLKVLCSQHPNFEDDWTSIKHCFYEEDGRLYNRRLELERSEQKKRAEKNSKNGKMGAMKRWNKKEDSEAIATPLPSNEIENEIEIKKPRKENKTNKYLKEFENEFWTLYPRRDNKKRAKDKYVQLRKSGTDKEIILSGLKNYIKQWRSAGTEPEFIPMASTWLHQERFEDELISNMKTAEKLVIAKKSFEYMCIECGAEKTFEEESYELCDCGEGILEDKKHVLQELARRKNTPGKPGGAAKQASAKKDGEVVPTPTLPESSEQAKDFSKMINSLTNSLGA